MPHGPNPHDRIERQGADKPKKGLSRREKGLTFIDVIQAGKNLPVKERGARVVSRNG
jgi:hypothetical protein